MSHLLGFGDFPEAWIGGPPSSTRGPKTTPKAASTKPAATAKVVGKPVKLKTAPPSKKRSPHKAAVLSAIDAGKSALSAGKRAASSAAKYQADAKSGKHAPLVPVAVHALGGSGCVAVGAAPSAPLSPKQRQAVNKHAGTVAKHALANKKLNLAAAKATKAGKDALAFSKDAAGYFKAALAGKRPAKTAVGAALADLVAAHGPDAIEELEDHEVIALAEAIGLDAQGLSPGQPGYDPSTDPDAQGGAGDGGTDPSLNASQGAGGLDPSTGIVTDAAGNIVYDPSQDPAIVPMPERGGKLSQADAEVVWKNVPEDGIVYDGSRGWPRYSKGSFRSFYGTQKDGVGQFGMIWGYDKMNWPSSKDPARWIRRYGQNGMSADEIAHAIFNPIYGIARAVGQGNDNWDDGFATDAAAFAKSVQDNAGALIGNPAGELAGLQYATADDKWFWQGQNAPVWATAEVDAKLALANKKTVEANTAAALVKVAEQQKAAAELAERKAKAEAEQALAQKQAEAEANVIKTKSDAEAAAAAAKTDAERAAADTAYQRQLDAAEGTKSALDAERQRAQIERMRRQAEIEAASQHAIIEQMNVWNEWAKQNPDEAVRQMAEAEAEDAAAMEGGVLDGGSEADAEAASAEPDVDYNDGQVAAFDVPPADDEEAV